MRKISFALALIFSFFVACNVHALTYTDTINEHGMWIPNEFVNKTKSGSTKYQQMTLIVRNSDGRFLYCIEPGKSINENNTFTGYDEYQSSYANLTEEQWNRINLLAYYGYGYQGHKDIKWYVITQFMIWQTNNLGYDIYFTNKLNGNRITKYEEEMQELEDLISNHYKTPLFENGLVGLLLGDDYTFIDDNNVLNEYGIVNNQNIELYTFDNELHLKNSDVNIENGSIEFKKISDRFTNLPTVYLDNESQNLLLPGNLDNVDYTLFFYTMYGSLHMYKVDSEWMYRKQASLENAVYGLYDSNYNLLEEKSTSENGEIYFDSRLKKGEYLFKEISPSEGYLLDENEYHFNVTRDDYNHNWNVGEQVIKENFEITKYADDTNNSIIIPESGSEFGLYDNENNLINIYTTNNDGNMYFSLDYGEYTLKQHTFYPGYEKMKDYHFKVKENDKYNKLIFIDNIIRYKVNLNVKNKKTLENISNIKFELYDNNNTKIYNGITDNDGNILFPNYFSYGKYYIKLVYDSNFDDDIIKFEINDDVSYKNYDDYRLVELKYFLVKEESKEIEEDPYQEEILENVSENEMINQENIIELPKGDIMENEIFDTDSLVVEVPNTLKNSNTNLLCLLLFTIYIKKKLI